MKSIFYSGSEVTKQMKKNNREATKELKKNTKGAKGAFNKWGKI